MIGALTLIRSHRCVAHEGRPLVVLRTRVGLSMRPTGLPAQGMQARPKPGLVSHP